jgi:hypothetical protein
MKTTLNPNHQVLLTFLVVLLLSIGCDKENNKPVTGALVTSHSDCKSDRKAAFAEETPDSLSCINYTYDAAKNQLNIKHINAGFNCCFDSIICDVKYKQDTLVIEEKETSGLCNCNCLYDLNISVTGVEPGKWVIKMVEPYATEPLEQLVFKTDLNAVPSGHACIVRRHYPWNMPE